MKKQTTKIYSYNPAPCGCNDVVEVHWIFDHEDWCPMGVQKCGGCGATWDSCERTQDPIAVHTWEDLGYTYND